LTFTTSETFRFSPHNLTLYLTQHFFADIINGQSLTIPQVEAYISVVSFSSVHTDYGTYHKYYSATRHGYVYRCDNPNFLQRYFNYSREIGVANYAMAADMGVLGVSYFNVTVRNNSTFPVNSIKLLGQLPDEGNYIEHWNALPDKVLQAGEIYLFPINAKELPTNVYATGYIAFEPLDA
jgi:hypothetical protein